METDNKQEVPNQEITEEKGFVVNVEEIKNDTGKEIDYDKLIKEFGCHRIEPELLERFEKLTGREPHIFLKRGIVE